MQINIENSDYPGCVDEEALISVVRQLSEYAQRDSGCAVPWAEISIYLMGDESIASVHTAIHGIDGTTDVISQRYEPVPGEPDGLSGEIFVNLQCAIREGKIQGWGSDKELALYIAHGCDHLTDAEDLTEDGFISMRSRELEWLQELTLTPLIIKSII